MDIKCENCGYKGPGEIKGNITKYCICPECDSTKVEIEAK